MDKYIILFIFVLTSNAMLLSQKVTVIDKESAKPLEAVMITDQSRSHISYTDEKGEADFSLFKEHERLFVSHFGYTSVEYGLSELKDIGYIIALTQAPFELNQVTVSASRWNQISKNVPVRVSTITPRDIAFTNPQTAADLLGNSGRVFIQKSQQGGGSPMIRGFATNRLLYAVDGVRMNTAIFRSGNIQNVISLDGFSFENVEILFGPGSVMYGSDAIGGVMAFQTWTPRYGTADKINISGGSTLRYSTANDEKTGHVHFNIGGAKWASVTSLSYNDFGDLRMGTNGPAEYLKIWNVRREGDKDIIYKNPDSLVQTPSGYDQYNIMQKFRFRVSDHFDLQYAFHHSATSEYARYDRHIRLRNGLPRHAEWSYGPQKWMMHQLTGTLSQKTGWYDEMIWRLAFQDFKESRMERDINRSTRFLRFEHVKAWSANIDLIKKLSEKATLNYGIEGVINDVASTGEDQDIVKGTSQRGPSRYPNAVWSSYAAFAGYDVKLSNKINVQAGARYSYYSQTAEFDNTFFKLPFTESKINNGALTGSMGMVYRPGDKTSIMASLSTGFRSPNVDDSGKIFDAVAGFVTVPNPELKAEYAYNAEIGFVHVFSDKVRLDASLYYTYVDNAMVKRNFQLNGQDSILYNGRMSKVEAIQNAANAKVRGAQIGLEIRPGYGFSLVSQYNIQRGEEEIDNGSTSPSRHAAPNFGATTLSWAYKNLLLSISSQYSDGKTYEELPAEEQNKPEIYAIDANKKPYSPSWVIYNVRMQYQISKHWSLNGTIENIADERYRPYSSGIVAPGRNFVISGSVRW
ncbi:MAG: TonB-dependent receptor [Saprospiraceae bacterium]|jgi:hemoglobin/transferrin/lactoferrin receptor protein|nr:TonB-dependent receptor [Saprospiraceae bacterium]